MLEIADPCMLNLWVNLENRQGCVVGNDADLRQMVTLIMYAIYFM